MEYHISINGSDKNPGTIDAPFLTISHGAQVAQAGDSVIVHAGTYRECVVPVHSGVNDKKRIVYKAADGEKVIIKGSEIISDWVKNGDNWYAEVPNSLFCKENPFATELNGDWFLKPKNPSLHTGAVYLNGNALTEQRYKEELLKMQWFAEVKDETTVILANFGDENPNKSTVEINVRPYCFAPAKSRIDYITVSGFEMAHSSCQWAPPTAEQQGMIWARWCKGWIIENNILHDARCSAISLGRDGDTGHNLTTLNYKKPGFRSQLEVVFRSKLAGWSKENIGSHIVRNNEIYNCGQTGIVGHMGGAFSEIYGNHIHHISYNLEFHGWELGGIKLHAAIDTYIHHNCIHDCHRGIWLDWQAQGVRVSSNLLFNNNDSQDLFIEVSHGPYLVDNNILNSKNSLLCVSQGGAFIHNWFGGVIDVREERHRYTPYHLPHSTDILGTAVICCADERFYQNVFTKNGTEWFNGCPASIEEYIDIIKERTFKTNEMDVSTYWDQRQPVYSGRNVYADETSKFDKETDAVIVNSELTMSIREEDNSFIIESNLPENLKFFNSIINTHDLEPARMPEQLFEDANGNSILLDKDITGAQRSENPVPGPIEGTKAVVFCFER